MATTETILVTGVLGQDGAYLSQLILEKGHRVVGGVRRSSTPNLWRLEELGIHKDVELVEMELLEDSNIMAVIEKVRPDRVFNLAAQSFVGASFQQPLFTSNVDALGVLRVLEGIRRVDPGIKFYQASTSEMFGLAHETPQSEETAFYPRSPYAVAKCFAHYITRNYREAHKIHASSGILFNHESPLRGEEFVTRKITSTLARIFCGSDEVLRLGNLNARRDWGHARDYVRGMWLMTEQPSGDDYVLATGLASSIREFVVLAARQFGWDVVFEGRELDEKGRDGKTGRLLVEVGEEFYRGTDVDCLVGDASKAKTRLDWVPETSLESLVREMTAADLRRSR